MINLENLPQCLKGSKLSKKFRSWFCHEFTDSKIVKKIEGLLPPSVEQALDQLITIPSKQNLDRFLTSLKVAISYGLISSDYFSEQYLDFLRRRTEEWEEMKNLEDTWDRLKNSELMQELLDKLQRAEAVDLPINSLPLNISSEERHILLLLLKLLKLTRSTTITQYQDH